MAAHLKRSLGLMEATFYGLGTIIGAGIYVLIGKAAGLAGNAVWAAFAIGAFIAAFTGLSYAELSSMFSKSGGEYVFVEKAFNKRLAFLVGWLLIIGGIVGAATVALGFAGYFNALFNTPHIPVAIALICVLSLLSLWGIKQSARVDMIGTIIVIGALASIVAFGLKHFGNVSYTELPSLGFSGILSATALVFFAFLGFEGIVRLSEETKNPERTIPRAIILSIIISTLVYISVAIATVSVVGWKALSMSEAPLALVAQTAMGGKAFFVLAFTALCATLTTVLSVLIAASRMIYGMAEDHGLPKIFTKVHKKFCTPWFAILVTAIATSAFVLVGKIEIVASITDFALFTSFAFVNLSLLMLRRKMPNAKRPFKTSALLAVLGIISSILMLTYIKKEAIFAGIVIIIIGIALSEITKTRH